MTRFSFFSLKKKADEEKEGKQADEPKLSESTQSEPTEEVVEEVVEESEEIVKARKHVERLENVVKIDRSKAQYLTDAKVHLEELLAEEAAKKSTQESTEETTQEDGSNIQSGES